MTKQETIDILKDLAKRLSHVPDSYDSETDIRAIEMAVACIETCTLLEKYIKRLEQTKGI